MSYFFRGLGNCDIDMRWDSDGDGDRYQGRAGKREEYEWNKNTLKDPNIWAMDKEDWSNKNS